MTKTGITFALTIALSIVTGSVVADQNWPSFRGADSTGVVDSDAVPPSTWSTTENVEWKTDIPGRGWSSPVVWGNKVFLTTVENTGETEPMKKGLYFGGERPELPTTDHKFIVMCLDLETGSIAWQRTVREAPPQTPIHIKCSYASETPIVDGERVYAMFGGMGLFCFDLDGNEIWQKELKPNKIRNGWGAAASPVLHGDRLYVVDDNDEDSSLMALDKKTGEEIWRTPRDEKSNWATPYVWENAIRTEIVTPGTGKVRSYDLDGNEIWSFEGMSSITIAMPYEYQGLLIVSSGYVGDQTRPLYAIKPGAEGDITLKDDETFNEFIAWSQPKGAPYNPSTIGYNGKVYVVFDMGLLGAYDATDGTEIIEKKRISGGRAFTTSPWAYDGKIFCLNEDGVTFVFNAGDEYELLGKNELAEDDIGMATPAVVGDRLILRTAARVYSIKKP